MLYIAILGRQPALGIAELERTFDGQSVHIMSPQSVSFECDKFDIQKFGGVLKAGAVVDGIDCSDWRDLTEKITKRFSEEWSKSQTKLTIGISVYNAKISTREIQKTGILLKQKLKKHNVSVRLVPNSDPALSTATSHHNKLGLSANKIELIIVKTDNHRFIVAKSTGSQNITAYANRDQNRPKRDAFVGMLPPKLAQIMINLACGQLDKSKPITVLDPFCGTGVILQEALLMGYGAYGTDLSAKMVEYTSFNLDWLSKNSYNRQFDYRLDEGNAITYQWQKPITAVVGETYLGQPFSAPPSPSKLNEVVNNCDHIITEFLKNLRPQIDLNTPICIAVPAWRDNNGSFTHLPLISVIARYGYKPHEFINVSKNDLLYYREDQIVAREILVLKRAS